ncbi:MAG TPA: electron transport complex subunit RsxG [Candidatus Omnitrophota bacterium]|nr:electron transport complex subunit RsxG [Candidatus Omnitrophota bacterium]
MITRDTLIHAVVLGGFSMAAAALLASSNLFTADEIKARAVEDLQASLTQVIPASIHDNSPVADAIQMKAPGGKDMTVYRAIKGGKVTGVAFESSGNGYAGEIRVIMGVDADGKILGVRVVKHNETPGLGDKIEVAKNDWITKFNGLFLGDPPVAQWAVKKDGGRFDQFAGATITPRGTVNAIRDGLKYFAANKAQMLEVR